MKAVLVWLACCALAAALGLLWQSGRAHTAWAAWERAAARAQALHWQAQRQQDAAALLAWQQHNCGPHSGWVQRRDGAWACTDKRGRASSRLLIANTTGDTP